MSFIWMIAAGLIAGVIAMILMPRQGTGRLFLLGVAGSFITGVMQYSENRPIGFIGPFIGAAILLAVYAAAGGRGPIAEKAGHDDLRKAA
jgi:uncharacterized membrane protein YeaQ/YmgE (transglycosylase-associated protein family)